MYLEKKRNSELKRRKGSTKRTIIQSIWLAISAVGAYFFLQYLVDQNILSYGQFYATGIPRSVPDWVFTVALVILITLAMQFVFVFAFVLFSPRGRQRVDRATTHSRNDDPFENNF